MHPQETEMSQLQIVERASPQNASDDVDVTAEIEQTRSDSYRKTLYEGLRLRDAWLRKAWGSTSPVVVEFQ
jgi:hypothetical protein